MQTRRARICRTNTWTQRGTEEKLAEQLNRLVTRIVSSRLATIRARQREKNTSDKEKARKKSKVCTVRKCFRCYCVINRWLNTEDAYVVQT